MSGLRGARLGPACLPVALLPVALLALLALLAFLAFLTLLTLLTLLVLVVGLVIFSLHLVVGVIHRVRGLYLRGATGRCGCERHGVSWTPGRARGAVAESGAPRSAEAGREAPQRGPNESAPRVPFDPHAVCARATLRPRRVPRG